MISYLEHVLALWSIYALLAASFNLTAGYAGLFSVGHAAFFGIGAYTSALLTTQTPTPFILALACAGMTAGLAGVVVGWPSLRLQGDYLAFATLGLAELTHSLIRNWNTLTGGWAGIAGIPRPHVWGLHLQGNAGYLALIVFVCAVCLLVLRRVVQSPFGRLLRAIREDEVLARTVGIGVARLKILAFVVGAVFAGIAGSLFAHFITYIDPSSFTVSESILVLSMAVLGGMGSLWGSVFGAGLLVIVPELLRFIGVPTPSIAAWHQLAYGLVLVVMMIWRPKGLLGRYAP